MCHIFNQIKITKWICLMQNRTFCTHKGQHPLFQKQFDSKVGLISFKNTKNLAICSQNCVWIWKCRDRKTVFYRMRLKKCQAIKNWCIYNTPGSQALRLECILWDGWRYEPSPWQLFNTKCVEGTKGDDGYTYHHM